MYEIRRVAMPATPEAVVEAATLLAHRERWCVLLVEWATPDPGAPELLQLDRAPDDVNDLGHASSSG
jgi:hypothetical protein